VVGEGHVLHSRWRITSTSAISSIVRVGRLWWWRKVDNWWFLSRVDNRPGILHLRSVKLLIGSSVTLLGGSLVPDTGSYEERSQ